MKQLIESMIGDYLEESYKDNLVESIFEEVSEETWEAIEEAILNELSPKTLASYVKKASADVSDKASHSGRLGQKSIMDPGKSDAANRLFQRSVDYGAKAGKRLKGISKAADRLAKK
jgi:hypothetical protein